MFPYQPFEQGSASGGGTDAAADGTAPEHPAQQPRWPAAAGAPAPSDAAQQYDEGVRRLLLLQTLAARQTALLQAQAQLGLDTTAGPFPSTSFNSFQPATSAAADAPSANSPQIASVAPTPPPTPAIDWSQIGHPGSWRPNAEAARAPASPAAVPARRASGTAGTWPLAQDQLDQWSSQVFVPTATRLPPLAPLAVSGLNWPTSSVTLSPPIIYPVAEGVPAAYPPAGTSPPRTYSSSWPSGPSAAREPSTTKPSRAKSVTRGKSAEKVPESENGSGDEDDKRRRNTEASARFRAKKKQRDAELQQSSVQLRERVTDLEKEASSLKAENQWLRDLIAEKTEPRPS